MTDNVQDGWIIKSNNKRCKKEYINTINFLDSINFCSPNACFNNKLKLSPSSFPNSCICGHLCEFRKINFLPDHSPGSDVAKIAPVNIKLRSL